MFCCGSTPWQLINSRTRRSFKCKNSSFCRELSPLDVPSLWNHGKAIFVWETCYAFSCRCTSQSRRAQSTWIRWEWTGIRVFTWLSSTNPQPKQWRVRNSSSIWFHSLIKFPIAMADLDEAVPMPILVCSSLWRWSTWRGNHRWTPMRNWVRLQVQIS